MTRSAQSRSPAPAKPPARRRALAVAALTMLTTLAALGAVLWYRFSAGPGYPLDDSWIHLAFARSLAEGAGFGVNPGEPTPGATSPLWVFLLAPGFLTGAAHTVWPWLLAALWLGIAGVLAGKLVEALAVQSGMHEDGRGRWAGAAAGLLLVLTGPLVWSAAGAMEVPLFVALLLATMLTFARCVQARVRGAVGWGVLAGLVALARPEGLLLPVILVVCALIRYGTAGARAAVTGALAAALVYAPSVIFCLSTSGRIFPNTFYAKTTALVAGAPDAGFLAAGTRLFWDLSPVAVIGVVLALLALASLRRDRNALGAALPVLGFTIGLPLAYAAMGRTFLFADLAGNFGRYFYPILGPALVLAGWGAAWGLARLPSARRRPAGLALLLIALAVTLAGTQERSQLYRQNVRDIQHMQVAMAERLASSVRPGTKIAANDVGALAYFTRARVLDLIGIVSTPTLEALEPAGEDPQARQRAWFALLQQERPEMLVVFPGWFTPVLERMRPGLSTVHEIRDAGNITSGGIQLAALRVDWGKI